jgi:TRAP-type C4-dicarboxylate transport system permease small subunit
MGRQGRLERRPTATAIVVGILSLVVSIAVVAGAGYLLFVWLRQVSPTLGVVLTWVGPIPLVLAVGWSTLFLMDLFEKTTGISLRTRSSRTSG